MSLFTYIFYADFPNFDSFQIFYIKFSLFVLHLMDLLCYVEYYYEFAINLFYYVLLFLTQLIICSFTTFLSVHCFSFMIPSVIIISIFVAMMKFVLFFMPVSSIVILMASFYVIQIFSFIIIGIVGLWYMGNVVQVMLLTNYKIIG